MFGLRWLGCLRFRRWWVFRGKGALLVDSSFSLRKVGWLFLREFFVKQVCRLMAIFLLFSKVAKVSMAQLLLLLPVPKRIFQDW